MTARSNTISKKKDFDIIFKKGKSAGGVFLVLKFIKNNLEINRFAFIVSKKVSLRAVVRNKIRRRLSESVKAFKDGKNGLDIVFIALPKIKDKNFFEINGEVHKLLEKAGIKI
jgi:ribonuclease P protein component